MKINVSMDDELVTRIDSYADLTYTTRSGLITTAVTQYLNSKEMIIAINDMGHAMKKIADKGEIDEETRKELDDFVRLASMLSVTLIK